MQRQNPVQLLSKDAHNLLINEAASAKTINDAFVSTITQFNHHEESKTEGEVEDTAVMKAEISKVLDRLDRIIEKVLKKREEAETAAAKWISIVGFVVVLLIFVAVVLPFVLPEAKNQLLPSVFSTLSMTGLLYLLYSPVQKRLQIADDRSNLVLMAATFRLRFTTAQTPKQFIELGQELSEALRIERGNP